MEGKKEKRERLQAANSFRGEELAILDFIFRTMLKGGNPNVVVRRPAFKKLANKFIGMKLKYDKKKMEMLRKQRPSQ